MGQLVAKIRSRISCFFIDFQTGRQKLGIILNDKVFQKLPNENCSRQKMFKPNNEYSNALFIEN